MQREEGHKLLFSVTSTLFVYIIMHEHGSVQHGWLKRADSEQLPSKAIWGLI